MTFEFSHLCSSAEPEKTAQFALQIINTVGWSTRSTTFDTIQAIEATSCLSGATPSTTWSDSPQLQMQFDQVAIHANGDIVVSPYIPLIIGNVRKHSLQEYYDAGMATVWDKPVITALANRMHSIDEMEEISSLIADINMDGDLYIDLIDDDLGDLSVLSQL